MWWWWWWGGDSRSVDLHSVTCLKARAQKERNRDSGRKSKIRRDTLRSKTERGSQLCRRAVGGEKSLQQLLGIQSSLDLTENVEHGGFLLEQR